MKSFSVDRILTESDVIEFNSIKPVIIELKNTKGQNPNIIRKLDSSNVIRVVGSLDDRFLGTESKENYFAMTLYSPEEISNIIELIEEIEKGINSSWSDLMKTTYCYIRLTKLLSHDSSREIKELDITKPLQALIKGRASSLDAAIILQELLDRQNITARTMCSVNGHYWNEIKLDNYFYPVDLSMDCEEKEENKDDEKEKEIESKRSTLRSFLSDKEFYHKPEHQARERTKADIEELCIMDHGTVQEVVDAVAKEMNNDEIEIEEKRPEVTIKSKELAGVFSKDTITPEDIEKPKQITISISDGNYEDLKSDISQIREHYPELLSDIQIENTTTSKANIQEVVDEIFAARKSMKDTTANQNPVTITISSSNPDDFNIDFSKAPKVQVNENGVNEREVASQTIAFKNNGTGTIKLPDISGKISPNIDCISVDGFDLSDFSIEGTDVGRMVFNGDRTTHITEVEGIADLSSVTVSGISATEFDDYIRNVYPTSSRIYSLFIQGQNFRDRKILQEIAVNPNITEIGIVNTHLNDIDGIEQLNGRLSEFIVNNNDLNVNDIPRIMELHRHTPYAYLSYSGNSQINNFIRSNASRLSDTSYNYLADLMYESAVFDTKPRLNREQVMDALTGRAVDYPFYIKDADLLCRDMHLQPKSMMIENDSEFQSVDFNATHIRNGSLLLTVAQAEHLAQLGITIPQKIELKLNDVSELTSDKARQLKNDLQTHGITLSGVRIFDPKMDNKKVQLSTYTLSEYIYIRETLDTITYGINPSDSDLDKFATIYVRLANSIIYDHDACKSDSRAESLYYAKVRDASRSLLEGLKDGKCVCAGYADILRNALALVGVECRINSGLADASDARSRHAWNQVKIDGKWYYTDLTWDRQKDDTLGQRRNFKWMLRGKNYFTNGSHNKTYTRHIEDVENSDFDRLELKRAIARAQAKSFDFRTNDRPIDIPADPSVTVNLDEQRIRDEFTRRRNDMLAKYYGNRDYQQEYQERSARYRQHEEESTINGYTYRTVGYYAEREEDEQFLLLDKYRERLERLSRYEAGDITVYSGTPDQINAAYEADREYVETRNHTFNEFETKSRDLATLGKYGERVPYIPRQQGVIRNIGRGVVNAGIAIRNAVSPIYRAVGRHIVQPIYNRITRGRDSSPYRNNIYHRIVARRDYFRDLANQRDLDETQSRMAAASDPSQVRPVRHPIRNYFESLFRSVFNVRSGNEAVLRAGSADIIDNIREQEQQRAIIDGLQNQIRALDNQIQSLQTELRNRPTAHNAAQVRAAIAAKQASRQRCHNSLTNYLKRGIDGDIQTDAISADQHAIASKEVTTFETTVVKGVMKGVALKLIGPKIHDWLIERGKTVQESEIVTADWQETKKWVPTTYKTETTDVYDTVLDTGKSMHDVIGANKGKEVNIFYSVYGGEKGAIPYSIKGDENITAVFQSIGKGGTGLSDKVGLTAPKIVDRTFGDTLLNSNGFLNQNVTINDLVDALNTGSVDMSTLQDVYVSIGDKGWAKLSDLVGDLTKQVKVDEITKRVVDVAGHYETAKKLVTTTKKVSEVVENPLFRTAANVHNNLLIGGATVDSILDIIENTRPTDTDVQSNKRRPRRYDYDDEEIQNNPIPTSGRDYDESR